MAVKTPEANADSSIAQTEVQETTVESGATQATAEGQQGQAQETAPAPEMLSIMGVEIDKSKVPPELLEKVDHWNREYTQKSQKLSEAEKKAAQLDQLANYPGFQKWYWQEINGGKEAPKEDPFKLTPERQAELLSDSDKFQQYVQSMILDGINRYAMPAANQAKEEAQVLRSEQEVSRLAQAYEDFDDLNDSGKIQEIVAQYAQRGSEIDLEDAYWLAKRPYMESQAELRAHQRVGEKINGSTLQPSGAPAGERVKTLPGKGLSFEDKVRIAAEHAFRGEKMRFDS